MEDLKKQLKDSAYCEFKNVFTDEAITKLKSLDKLRNKDSVFISTALKDLYRNDMHRLVGTTYSGRTKEPMTPDKINVLRALFTERLTNVPDSAERMEDLGKHVKTACRFGTKFICNFG